MADKEYFRNIEQQAPAERTNSVAGDQYIQNLISLGVGSGSRVWRADQQGQWMGGETFEEAKFRVDMDGNLRFSSDDGQLQYDNGNTRLVVYDALGNPIILIGKQVGGF